MWERYTAADRKQFLAELAKSGDRPSVVAERVGIDLSTAYRWRRASGAPFKPRKRKQPIFARVVPTQAASQTTGLVVEIGPALVRVESGFDANLLRAIVIALGSGSA